MTAMLLAGAAVGLGLLLIVRGLAPARPDIAVSIGQWQVARRRSEGRATVVDRRTAWTSRLGQWLGDQIAKRGVELPGLQADLALLGRSFETFLASLVLYAAAGFLLPTIGAGVAELLGLPLGFLIPSGVGVFLAAMMVVAQVSQARTEAAARREELRRALGSYLDLVSMALAGGRGIGDALPLAAGIGDGWAFDLLAETVSTARRSGQTVWAAIGDLGSRFRIDELTDLAAALELVGSEGAKVRETLEARADTLRSRQLAAAHSQAEANNESMNYALYFFVAGFMVLIFYPAFQLVLNT